MTLSSKEKIQNVSTYINNLNTIKNFDDDIITVEHRSNNPKRDYLFVNRRQCKHIPCSPESMALMCIKLANEIKESKVLENKKVLLVGFAETATAIANILADNIGNIEVLQTTREVITDDMLCENDKVLALLRFEEEHSHATSQTLLTSESSGIKLDKYDYILFAEDEISTGNTILNFIKAMKEEAENISGFGVASICNWQSDKNRKIFETRGIDIFALITGSLENASAKMEGYTGNSEAVINTCENELQQIFYVCQVSEKCIFTEERLGHNSNRNLNKYGMYDKIKSIIMKQKASVRIVGTEEFMYIPVMIGRYLESEGHRVICHSTTRSSIDICDNNAGDVSKSSYNLISKYKVPSVYEKDRNTYIYNIDEYTDYIFLVTDIEVSNENALFYQNLFSDRCGLFKIIILT